jgi:hypothetical protein
MGSKVYVYKKAGYSFATKKRYSSLERNIAATNGTLVPFSFIISSSIGCIELGFRPGQN